MVEARLIVSGHQQNGRWIWRGSSHQIALYNLQCRITLSVVVLLRVKPQINDFSPSEGGRVLTRRTGRRHNAQVVRCLYRLYNHIDRRGFLDSRGRQQVGSAVTIPPLFLSSHFSLRAHFYMLINTSEAGRVGRLFGGVVSRALDLLVKGGFVRGHTALLPTALPVQVARFEKPVSLLRANFLLGMNDLPAWHFHGRNLALEDGDAFQTKSCLDNSSSTLNHLHQHSLVLEPAPFHRHKHDSFITNRKTTSFPRR